MGICWLLDSTFVFFCFYRILLSASGIHSSISKSINITLTCYNAGCTLFWLSHFYFLLPFIRALVIAFGLADNLKNQMIIKYEPFLMLDSLLLNNSTAYKGTIIMWAFIFYTIRVHRFRLEARDYKKRNNCSFNQ